MPPSPVVFRPATNADCPLAARIISEVLAEYGLVAFSQGQDTDLLDLDANYVALGGAFEIIESPDGAPLGMVGWRLAADGSCELKKLYLLPAARGRGVGRAALARVVDRARAAGCAAVLLETASVLREAIALYERAGFVPVDGDAAGPFAAVMSAEADLVYRLEL